MFPVELRVESDFEKITTWIPESKMYIHHVMLAAAVLQCSFLLIMPSPSLAEKNRTVVSGPQLSGTVPIPQQLSPEEKEWYTTFHEGTFCIQGWKEISAEVLEKVPHKNVKGKLYQSLQSLGVRIGREWSKDNDIRKIDNEMLSQWGDLLKRTAEQDPSELPQLIAELQKKVVALTN